MSTDIQMHPGAPGEGSLALPSQQPAAEEGPAPVSLVAAFTRRWRMILVLWLVPTVVLIPGIWLSVRRSYTATAQVQVSPILQPILYADDSTRAMPFFDAFLNTQMELITSQQVLTTALADPAVRDLPLAKMSNGLAILRASTAVQHVGSSHLLEIAVTQGSEAEALRLTKAITEAYMARVVGADEVEQRKKLKVLEETREQIKAQLQLKHKERSRLTAEYGAMSEDGLDLRQRWFLEPMIAVRAERERVQLEIIQYQGQLKQLESPSSTAPLTEAEATLCEQMIENDAIVRAVGEQQVEAARQLWQFKASGFSDEHPAVIAVRSKKEQLDKQIEQERARAAQDAEKFIRERRDRPEGVKNSLQQKLAAAQQRLQLLDENIKKEEDKSLAFGKRAAETVELQEEIKRLKEEYDRVDEEIRKLDIERFRPARVSVASEAELRPQGVKDRRKKLAVAVTFGCLFLSLAAALVRDRLDPHLRAPEEVTIGMGLRVLGAVPCLSELRSGKVAREDFIESYRLVRTTLAAMGADGVPPKSILVTSAQAAEGKTSLAVSLAASLAEPGCRVLLIDGDLQAPQIRRLLKLTPRGGLEGVLLGQRELSDSVTPSNLPGVDVLVSGVNGISGQSLLNHRSAAKILHEAADMYDHIVIDSSPALSSAGTLVWASLVTGVIVSSMASQSNMTAMRLGCERLRAVGARLLGSVIGNVSRRESYYSYSSASIAQDGQSTGTRGSRRREPPVVQLPNVQEDDSNEVRG